MRFLAPHLDEDIRLLDRFDTFGKNLQTQTLSKGEDGTRNGDCIRIRG